MTLSILNFLIGKKHIKKAYKRSYREERQDRQPLMRRKKKMQERSVEKALVQKVKKRKGLALKFISPGMSGVPDRIVLMPEGRMAFVELKAPGKKPRPLQVCRMQKLQRLGFRCYVVDSTSMIDEVLDEIGGNHEVCPS